MCAHAPFRPTSSATLLLELLSGCSAQRALQEKQETTGSIALTFLISNIVILPVNWVLLGPSSFFGTTFGSSVSWTSETAPMLIAVYAGNVVSAPSLWRLLARIE